MSDNVYKLPGVEEPQTEWSGEEIEEYLDNLKETGPYRWIMGVACRADGKLVPFNSPIDLRDLAFGLKVQEEVFQNIYHEMMEDE